MSDKINVCAYCRVSTNNQDQANSFENQKSYFNRELSKNKNYKLVEIYADKGISGTKLNREEFNRMLTDAGLKVIKNRNVNRKTYNYTIIEDSTEAKFKYIFVKNTSRFARNIEVVSILRKLKQKGVYVVFLDIGKSTENQDDMTFIEIFLTFDERESVDKSKKVKFGHQESARKGRIHTNSKLYGYKYIKSENRLEIIKEEAQVVRKIFKLYSEGEGIRKIVNHLRDNNIIKRNGKEFTKSTISAMLQNEKYAGINIRCKYDTGEVFHKHYPVRNYDNEIKVDVGDKIPSIISRELFEKCQQIRSSKVSTKNQRGVYHGLSKWSGKIYCEKCGATYTKNSDKGRVFYNCSTKKTKGTKYCNNVNVNLNELEDTVEELAFFNIYKEDFIDTINFRKKDIDLIIEELGKEFDKDTADEVVELESQLNELLNQKDRLVYLFMQQKIDDQKYDSFDKELNIQIEEIKIDIKDKSKTNEQIKADIQRLIEIKGELENIEVKDSYTANEVFEQLERIYVSKDNNNKKMFTFKYRFDETLEEIEKKYEDEFKKAMEKRRNKDYNDN